MPIKVNPLNTEPKTENFLIASFQDFISLIYPDTCCCCETALAKAEMHICLSCEIALPIIIDQTIVGNKFMGKIPYHTSVALYQYAKLNSVQNLLDEIKYKNNQELALYLGQKMGKNLMDKSFDNYDGIVPVPLHLSKQKKRGYNQSELLAKGMSEACGLPIFTQLLTRTKATETQTLKQRFARWTNVETVFSANEKVQGMKLILLDDVLTTGATLVACAESLLKKGSTEISFMALASAV